MEKNNYKVSVTRHNVTKEEIDSLVSEGIVNFVFLDEEYSAISRDKEVHEIHKFKSKYPAKSYIVFPLNVLKNEEGKIDKVEFTETKNPHGYAFVSKHELRDYSKDMKNAKLEERVKFSKRLCFERLRKLNELLSDDVLNVSIMDKNNNVLKEQMIKGGKFEKVNQHIQRLVRIVDKNKTQII